MIACIDEHRGIRGVEPICEVLPIAPSTCHAHAARRADPGRPPARVSSDAALMVEIRRVFEADFRVCGVRKAWRQLGREGIVVARCTVARMMRSMALRGAVRGKTVRTTVSDPAAACPLERVNRQFKAPRPNAPWVGGFTCVATWAGFVCVAFVIDAWARRIVGWRVSRTAHAAFVLDALEQALHERRPFQGEGPVHHGDRGSQYLAPRHTERLAEAGAGPSVGDACDSYDCESFFATLECELLERRRFASQAETRMACFSFIEGWYNPVRLHSALGYRSPMAYEAATATPWNRLARRLPGLRLPTETRRSETRTSHALPNRSADRYRG